MRRSGNKIKSSQFLYKLRKFLIALITVSYCVVAMISIVSLFGGNIHFVIDLFSHFQLQYTVGFLACAVFIILMKQLRLGVIMLAYPIFLTLVFILPINLNRYAPGGEPADIYYMNMNLLYGNHDDILSYIDNNSPETVAIVELHPDLHARLDKLYDKTALYTPGVFDSCGIYTNAKVVSSRIEMSNSYPICIVQFEKYTMLLVHPFPPFTQETWQKQKNYFKDVEDIISELKAQDQKYLLIGDFNSTRYSAIFRTSFNEDFKSNTYSWNTSHPLMLPIDHAISNMDIDVMKGEAVSSDHLGLFVNL